MPRIRTAPLAIAALLVSTGAVAAASLPDAAANGLATASSQTGFTVPVRPAAVPDVAPAATPVTQDVPPATPDAPPATTHGSAVSAVATAPDTTLDTNHGADVSAVAKDNAGQTIAATHRPTDVGKPTDPGKPTDVGKPADPGKPAAPGRP